MCCSACSVAGMNMLNRQRIFILLICWQGCNFRISLSSAAFYVTEGRKTCLSSLCQLSAWFTDLHSVLHCHCSEEQKHPSPCAQNVSAGIRLDAKYNSREFNILAGKIRKGKCGRRSLGMERKAVVNSSD